MRLMVSVLSLQAVAKALSLAMCSTQNTGTSNFESTYQYNSNGYCHDKCDGYAYAIVQGESCWCSNYAPGDTTSLSECDVACPGFGYEYCGDSSKGVFGYVALGPSASGTSSDGSASTSVDDGGASSSTSDPDSSSESDFSSSTEASEDESSSSTSSSETQAETTQAETTQASSTEKQAVQSTTTSDSSTSSTPKSTQTAQQSSTTVQESEVVSTYYSVSTMTGDSQKTVTQTLLQTLTTAQTQTSTPSAASSGTKGSSQGGDNGKSNGFFSDSGKVAGVFTAVGVVCAVLIAGLAFFLRRKIKSYRAAHNQYQRYSDDGDSPFGDDAASNVMPRLDYSDLESNAHQHDYEEKRDDMTSSPPDSSSATRRAVSSFIVDPRLDPNGPLYSGGGDDYSNRSLSDDIDYSRKVLKVTNA